MTSDPFDKVKNQIGYCGIWCGSCVVANGQLRELTKKQEEIIKNYDVEQWGPKDFDFKEFMSGLKSIQGMPLCPGCLKGGGRDNCEIRACASSKNIKDCSECGRPEECKNAELLENMQTGAVRAGMFVKTDVLDPQELIKRWTAELKR